MVREKIRKYIENNFVVFDDDIVFDDNDNIFKKGFVNSLFAMKLLSFVENEFAVQVEDDEIEISNFSSVNNIINLINRKRSPN